MKKTTIKTSAKILVLIVLILILTACETRINPDRSNASEDVPLSEFIIGRWKYEGKHKFENSNYLADVYWEYTFEDEGKLLIWTGDDGGRCTYKFIEAELLSIDCSPRMIDLMTWSVKRDGQNLLVQRMSNNELGNGEQLEFQRVEIR